MFTSRNVERNKTPRSQCSWDKGVNQGTFLGCPGATRSASQVGIGGLAGKPDTWQVSYHGGSMLQFLRSFWLLTLSKRYLPSLKAPPLLMNQYMSAHPVGLSVLPWPCRGQTHARKQTRVPGHLLGSKVVEGQGLRCSLNRRFCLSVPSTGCGSKAFEKQDEAEGRVP